MNAIVFDPEGILDPTPLARRPSSLVNDITQSFAVGPWLSCVYSIDAPVSGSITELIAPSGGALMPYEADCSRMVRMSAAMAKRDDTVG